VYAPPQITVAHNSTLASLVYPFAAGARLVDVIVYQWTAGVGGTSWTATVRNSAGTALLSTLSVLTLAAGAAIGVDAKAEMSLPAGCTRPVLKTDTTVDVSKGSYIDILTSETGSYSTHASARFVLVFEPKA
jgi:hypothetical protein